MSRLFTIVIFSSALLGVAHSDATQNTIQETRMQGMQSVWRPVQQQARDTVVQIFSHIAEIDITQPYKTPSQHGARGSGFFIDGKGHIITNAHVVNQAVAIWILIPSLGKRFIDVVLVGICPERDLALLKIADHELAYICSKLGDIPYLPLGNSDDILRSEEVLALGYPLGQESLKSTTGVMSGRESGMIQVSAPINPGSSGGPLLDVYGNVIGITTAGIRDAQNVGYCIPVNDLMVVLPDLYEGGLIRRPYLGIATINGSEALTRSLGNPAPGGCYVIKVIPGSPAEKAGLQCGDMMYSFDGNELDMYGEVSVAWSEDRISITTYIARLSVGTTLSLVIYRRGERKELTVIYDYVDPLPICTVYPGYEKIDYEVFAGMVVMPLTLNHAGMLVDNAPGLLKFKDMRNQIEPELVLAHVLPGSQLSRSRTVGAGVIIRHVNGCRVRTLEEYRAALKKSRETGYITINPSDNLTDDTDEALIVLSLDDVLTEEVRLSRDLGYPLSNVTRAFLGLNK